MPPASPFTNARARRVRGSSWTEALVRRHRFAPWYWKHRQRRRRPSRSASPRPRSRPRAQTRGLTQADSIPSHWPSRICASPRDRPGTSIRRVEMGQHRLAPSRVRRGKPAWRARRPAARSHAPQRYCAKAASGTSARGRTRKRSAGIPVASSLSSFPHEWCRAARNYVRRSQKLPPSNGRALPLKGRDRSRSPHARGSTGCARAMPGRAKVAFGAGQKPLNRSFSKENQCYFTRHAPNPPSVLRIARLHGVCCVVTLANGRAIGFAPRLASIRPAAQRISR